jgi:hypothetical protein
MARSNWGECNIREGASDVGTGWRRFFYLVEDRKSSGARLPPNAYAIGLRCAARFRDARHRIRRETFDYSAFRSSADLSQAAQFAPAS